MKNKFNNNIVIFQSDDWGKAGVRDQEGFNELKEKGLNLGLNPYDFYTLETAEDIRALYQVMLNHKDSMGNPPRITMNFITSNIDFQKTKKAKFKKIFLYPLSKGLPKKWKRPGLLEAYKEGIKAGIFHPSFHGLTHFCKQVAERHLSKDNEKSRLLRTLYNSSTPYIYHLMPWISYEYLNAKTFKHSFLCFNEQIKLIKKGIDYFYDFFEFKPISACAPGYRANKDTEKAYASLGIKVIQRGPNKLINPYFNHSGLLELQRNTLFEPALDPGYYSVETVLKKIKECFSKEIPAIIAIHSINFHSSIKDYRTVTLKRLDQLLSILEKEYKNLLYFWDGDLYNLIKDEQKNQNSF